MLAIGIDGLRTDAADTANTPHIAALKANGSYTNVCKVLGTRYQKNDCMKHGWTSYLTGVWAKKHGSTTTSLVGVASIVILTSLICSTTISRLRTASFIDWYPIDKYIVSQADVRVGLEAHGSAGYTIR